MTAPPSSSDCDGRSLVRPGMVIGVAEQAQLPDAECFGLGGGAKRFRLAAELFEAVLARSARVATARRRIPRLCRRPTDARRARDAMPDASAADSLLQTGGVHGSSRLIAGGAPLEVEPRWRHLWRAATGPAPFVKRRRLSRRSNRQPPCSMTARNPAARGKPRSVAVPVNTIAGSRARRRRRFSVQSSIQPAAGVGAVVQCEGSDPRGVREPEYLLEAPSFFTAIVEPAPALRQVPRLLRRRRAAATSARGRAIAGQ